MFGGKLKKNNFDYQVQYFGKDDSGKSIAITHQVSRKISPSQYAWKVETGETSSRRKQPKYVKAIQLYRKTKIMALMHSLHTIALEIPTRFCNQIQNTLH